MRVDGSLMGIDDKANTLIPQWKRGHFSLLFDGRPTPASLLLVDHRKQTVVDLTKESPLRCSPPDATLEQGSRLWKYQHCTSSPGRVQWGNVVSETCIT